MEDEVQPLVQLPFPPLMKSHILHCSYHDWYPRYRRITPKSRLIPLPTPFINYLKADGIILPPDDGPTRDWDDHDSGVFSSNEAENDDADDDEDPSLAWRPTHEAITSTIDELGGSVAPKLNWSAPKDATWINATNSMDCRSPNDIYMMLKSSDFVTHDLDYAFDGCQDADGVDSQRDIPFHLTLRKHVNFNPSVEFRCFVRRRRLLGICQRDSNHFDFLFKMQDDLREKILTFFDKELRDTFPDDSFAFDVYIPAPHNKVWLVDINPWAQRTDPILFSWLELLTMPDLAESETSQETDDHNERVEGVSILPELRLIHRDDPEARSFNTPKYSAHKMPRDVVDASQAGPGAIRDFAEQWKRAMDKQQEEAGESSGDE